MGWCALDPKRRLLTGMEQRGCWQERPVAAQAQAVGGVGGSPRSRRAGPSGAAMQAPSHPVLDFVPVDLVAHAARRADPEPVEPTIDTFQDAPALPVHPEPEPGWGDRTSLFGEPEA